MVTDNYQMTRIPMEQAQQENSLLSFFVGPYYFCVPSVEVESIITPPRIHSIPLSPRSISGMFPHRGDVAVVVSLRSKFGLPERTHKDSGQLILSKLKSGLKAFWVDEVLETTEANELDWYPATDVIRTDCFEKFAIKQEDLILYTGFEQLYAADDSELAKLLRTLTQNNKHKLDSSLTTNENSTIDEQVQSGDGDASATDREINNNTVSDDPNMHAIEMDGSTGPSAHEPDASPHVTPAPHIDFTRLHKKTGITKNGKPGPGSTANRYQPAYTNRRSTNADGQRQYSGHGRGSVEQNYRSSVVNGASDSYYNTADHRPASNYYDRHNYLEQRNSIYGNTSDSDNETGSKRSWVIAVMAFLTIATLVSWWLWPDSQYRPSRTSAHETGNALKPEVKHYENENRYQSIETNESPVQYNNSYESKDSLGATSTTKTTTGNNVDQPLRNNTERNPVEIIAGEYTITVERPKQSLSDVNSGESPVESRPDTSAATAEKSLPAKKTTAPADPRILEEYVHVVVKGDTLWHIARRYLGNPFRYPELA
ncbi:MAG: chemotaxis protein CheW, partial [Gammaproteobacteria bacterium]|nr:chemotaxis protein CheW [Gammaproteobacteria bacterium]